MIKQALAIVLIAAFFLDGIKSGYLLIKIEDANEVPTVPTSPTTGWYQTYYVTVLTG